MGGKRLRNSARNKDFTDIKGARGIKMVLFRQSGVIMNLKKIRRPMKQIQLKCPLQRPVSYAKIGKAEQVTNLTKKVDSDIHI